MTSPRGLGFLIFFLAILAGIGVRADSPPSRLTSSGDPIEANVESEQTHTYRIDLQAGQFLEVVIEQLGADVVANTFAPDGQPLLEFDSPGSGEAPEPVYLLASAAGTHTIEVRAYRGAGGDYTIRVETLRAEAENDQTRMRAEKAFIDGRVWRRNGDPESVRKALAEFEVALQGFAELGDGFRQADTLVYMGGMYQIQRESRKALEVYHRAIDLFGEFGQRRRQGITWINIGWCHDNLGDYPAALNAYANALEIHEELGNKTGVATTLGSLGLVHQALGDSQGALELHESAYEQWASMDYARGEGVALRDLGLAYERAGFTDRALDRYTRALQRFEEHGPRRRAAQALVDLSRVEHELGDLASSMRHAEAGLALYRMLEDRRGQSRALLDLGRRQYAQGQSDAALGSFAESVALAREVEDRYTTAWSLYSIARVKRDLGRGREALEDLRTALEIVENVRGRLADDNLRSLQLASTQPLYELAVELSLETDGDEAAFAISESGRARALVEAMARAGRDVFGLASPDLARVREEMGARTALVSFRFVADDLFVFVVTGETIATHRLGLDRAEVTNRVSALVDLLAKDDDEAWRPITQRLGKNLLDPWIASLGDDVESLWIVPDGPLFHLPFEVLTTSGRPDFLLETFEISYLPAVALLGLHEEAAAEATRILVFAAPGGLAESAVQTDRNVGEFYRREGFELGALPFSEREGRAIKARGGAAVELRVGDEATEASLKSDLLKTYSVLHFATHGLVSRSPELSALLLAGSPDDDGYLQSREILDLELDCELVVLSACRTARGRFLRGEGTQGLVRSFFYAGARSVVASLWDVRDASTARLMDRFYSHLAAGHSKSAALRLAKLDLAAREETASPRHWAGFVLIGEPEGTIPLGAVSAQRGRRWLVGLAAVVALFALVWLGRSTLRRR